MKYSVVIPLKNEEENIADLIDELEPIMQSLKNPWELLCIDDGSTDNTVDTLSKLIKKKPFLRVLTFDRNYGQSCAFDAGFKHARGEWIITLDGDRQNDPADIPKLLALTANNDLICGHRIDRQDPWHKKITSKLANFVRSRFCSDDVQDTGCSLKVYRKACLNQIKMYKGMHRFLPALFKIEGFRIAEVPVNHRERVKGITKYNFFNRSFNTIADMLAVRWMCKRHIDYRIDKEIS
jgi:dolichol-phosphate mannosyltransferase